MTGAGHNAVHLNAILDALFRECLGESGDGGIGRGDGGEGRLGIERGAAGHEDDGALSLLQRVPCPDRQTAGAVQFQLHAGVPLLIGHLEEIDLRHGARDIQQRVDSSEALERRVDDGLRRFGLAQVERKRKRFGSRCSDCSGDFFKFLAHCAPPERQRRNRGPDGSQWSVRFPGWLRSQSRQNSS